MKSRISRADITDVGLEVLHVYGIHTYDGGVKAYVGLGDVGAKVKGPGVGSEVGFSAIEGGEESGHSLGVDGLGPRDVSLSV